MSSKLAAGAVSRKSMNSYDPFGLLTSMKPPPPMPEWYMPELPVSGHIKYLTDEERTNQPNTKDRANKLLGQHRVSILIMDWKCTMMNKQGRTASLTASAALPPTWSKSMPMRLHTAFSEATAPCLSHASGWRWLSLSVEFEWAKTSRAAATRPKILKNFIVIKVGNRCRKLSKTEVIG